MNTDIQSTPSDFDRQSLRWFARRADPAALVEGRWEMQSWYDGRRSLESVFSLARHAHFLHHPQGVLPQLWEWQVTRALKGFLVNTPSRTLERCQALFSAMAGSTTYQLTRVDRITADDETRIDFAIHACTREDTEEKDCCLVIEAKLDSELSESQLPKYRNIVRAQFPDEDQRLLFVVAPRKTRKTSMLLDRRENHEWRFMTWRRLLLNWQMALPEDPGGDALSLFSEIWKRVGGR